MGSLRKAGGIPRPSLRHLCPGGYKYKRRYARDCFNPSLGRCATPYAQGLSGSVDGAANRVGCDFDASYLDAHKSSLCEVSVGIAQASPSRRP